MSYLRLSNAASPGLQVHKSILWDEIHSLIEGAYHRLKKVHNNARLFPPPSQPHLEEPFWEMRATAPEPGRFPRPAES